MHAQYFGLVGVKHSYPRPIVLPKVPHSGVEAGQIGVLLRRGSNLSIEALEHLHGLKDSFFLSKSLDGLKQLCKHLVHCEHHVRLIP